MSRSILRYMREIPIVFSFFKITLLSFMLNACLPASNFKGEEGLKISEEVVDDDDDGGVIETPEPPTQETLDEINAMSSDPLLAETPLAALTDNQKLGLLNSIDKKGTNHSPVIGVSDAETRLSLSFDHKELKDAVVDQLTALGILKDQGISCSSARSNCVACTYSCTFSSTPGNSLSKHRDFLVSISGVTATSSALTLALTPAARSRIQAEINDIKERLDLEAGQQEAARIAQCDAINATSPIYFYHLTNSSNSRSSKNYVHTLNPYLSSGSGYALQGTAFQGYSSANAGTVPIYQIRNNGRIAYRQTVPSGWTNDGPAFRTYSGYIEFSNCVNPPSGKTWTLKKTIPVMELYQMVTVKDGRNSVRVARRRYFPDTAWPNVNTSFQTLLADGWLSSGHVFWIAVP